MFRICLSIVLLVFFAVPARADDDAKKRSTKTTKAISVNELMERMAKSPLGSGEAVLLKAIADLIERERAAAPKRPDVTQASATLDARPAPIQTAAAAIPTSIGQRERCFIRLGYASAVEVARAIQDHLRSEQQSQTDDANGAQSIRTIIVHVPVVNGILISGTQKDAQRCTDLISQFDDPPDSVVIDAWVAELVPPTGAAKSNTAEGNHSSATGEPNREEAPAEWIAWATKHRRVEVLSRPQIRTLENLEAGISVGGDCPPECGSEFSLAVIPQISAEGLVTMQCDAKRIWFENNKKNSAPIRRTTTAETTVSAKINQTVWLEGLTSDGKRTTIMALTPRDITKE